ncbi:MAG TPA: hypothetical protein VG943_16275 [Caulobacterales bacterium]|nr:hypothetical protein [Vitreimonas sp.]HVY86691.1 hypothetical protein [Caulobacterales bacterium]
MRFNGFNILAIIVAAIAIYAIEFVIFAVLIPGPTYQHMVGMSDAQATASMAGSRMPYGIVMPILAAIGLALVVKWRQAVGLAGGFITGALMGVLFGFAATMYSYVYGAATEMFLGVTLIHYILCYGVAGAILSAWK